MREDSAIISRLCVYRIQIILPATFLLFTSVTMSMSIYLQACSKPFCKNV